MRKQTMISGIILLIFGMTILNTPVLNTPINAQPQQEWTSLIRIEGKLNTIWYGEVTVGETTIDALNESSGEIEKYTIPYPSVLGAVDEASKKGGFSYQVSYYPSWHAFFITSIDGDSNWWHYWVDYNLPMIDVGSYKLSDTDKEILFGYIEDWYAHALRIDIDKTDVHKNEEIRISVFDETMMPVENATIYVDSQTYTTNKDGYAVIKLANRGDYPIYAEKNGYVRSEKITVHVKTLTIPLPQEIIRLFQSLSHLPIFFNYT